MLAAACPGLGIGFVGVALAFGLKVLTMATAIGPISRCHLNLARSTGPTLFLRGRLQISRIGAKAGSEVTNETAPRDRPRRRTAT